ncbi:MAG: UPF0175 family protein [Desulfotignum sp.]|nr:UPF0175 family protein [Desulfotignum sp.]
MYPKKMLEKGGNYFWYFYPKTGKHFIKGREDIIMQTLSITYSDDLLISTGKSKKAFEQEMREAIAVADSGPYRPGTYWPT